MINSASIPEKMLDDFCYYLKDVIKAFYEVPENQAAFENWMQERNNNSFN